MNDSPKLLPTTPWLTTMLQTHDTFFPTGAYAHSFGFEELMRLKGGASEPDLLAFAQDHLIPSLANQELPYLRFAFECAHDLDTLCALDAEISSWKVARELREASVQIGRRRLAVLEAVTHRDLYDSFSAAVRRGQAPGHHLTVSALQAHAEEFPLDALLPAYFYQSISGACAASLKLLRIGQEACQRVLHHCLAQSNDTIRTSMHIPRESAGWFDPLLDIASMRHERADERLFIS